MTYLATVFTTYYLGHKAAWLEACRLDAALKLQGRQVFSPIAYGYSLVLNGGLPAVDHALWMEICRPYMEFSDSLLVAMMDGWKKSRGIAEEIAYFREQGKPVAFLNPHTMKAVSA